jgi:hypothetical protein
VDIAFSLDSILLSSNMDTAAAYKSDNLNSLPTLETSYNTFRAQDGLNLLGSTFQDLVDRHGLVGKLGLILLHRHFNLARGEALVDTNGVITPWNLTDASPSPDGCYSKHGGLVKPRAWYLSSAKEITPYEFYFCPPHSVTESFDTSPLDLITQAFIDDFASVLQKHGLQRHVGICLLRSPLRNQVETTEGRANITFDVPDDYDMTQDIQAIWSYKRVMPSEKDAQPYIQHGCSYNCLSKEDTHISGGHFHWDSGKPHVQDDLIRY